MHQPTRPQAPQSVNDRIFCAVCGKAVDAHDSMLAKDGSLVLIVACHGSVGCAVIPPVEQAPLMPRIGLAPVVFFADQASGANRAVSARKAIARYMNAVGGELPQIWSGLRQPSEGKSSVLPRRRRMDFSAPGAEAPNRNKRSRVLEE